jgi:hypothetical protein
VREPQAAGRRSAGRTAARFFPLVALPLPLLVLLTAPSPLRAQSTGPGGPPAAAVYLPLGHPAYETLDRLVGAGLLPELVWGQRPFTRTAVARALADGAERADRRGLSGLASSTRWRMREFIVELRALGRDAGIEPRRAPLRLDWEGDQGARFTGEMTLELAWDGRSDLPPDFKPAPLGRGGMEVYGTAGPTIGFAARYRQTSEARQGTIKEWPYAPVQNIAQLRTFGKEWAAYTESSGHLSLEGTHLSADLVFDSPAWGPSPGWNLLLSGHAPSFGHLQGRVRFGEWLRYTALAGSLKSGLIDSTRSYQPEEPTVYRALERQKFLLGHRLDLKPLPGLQIGLTEMVIAADRFPELLYFVPTVSIWDAQHYLNDPDNTMIALDAAWSPAGGPRLYGAVALDEWQMGDTFADSTSHNWLAFQLGVSWTPPLMEGRWHLWVEATRVLPNVYRHKFPVNDWTHAGSWLGFPSAQNSQVVEGRLDFLVSPRLQLGAWGRYALKGGEVDRIEQYLIPPSEPFLIGPDRIGSWLGLTARLEGEAHWSALAEVVRAPATLWPHDRSEGLGAVTARAWQVRLVLTYNPF